MIKMKNVLFQGLLQKIKPPQRKCVHFKWRSEFNTSLPCTSSLDSALCRVLGVDLPEPRRGILLKLYVQTVLFCRKQSFRKEQTSTLLSIIKSIHEANIETPLNNLEQCLDYCNELLLCHCCHRPPFSVSFFSYQEANCILDYIHNSYLMHHELYKYFFAPQVQVDLPLTYSGMEKEESTASEKPGESHLLLYMVLSLFLPLSLSKSEQWAQ
uniref:Uncharacterized protein n=1 Tax=Nothobranchius furzeri TaxID=105023 RepID=A0A8C6KZY7_NOTFU